ncbi:hypothetical protein UACE39S_04916 [Ureibacillus acetophenoni]
MTISKKIVSALVVSSLAFSSFAPSLANAKSVELEPIASPQLTGYSDAELEKLAIEILANGKFSNVVVTEGDILEVPEGFTPISNFSFTEGSTITPFGVDPGGGTSYWDGWYTYNTDIPTGKKKKKKKKKNIFLKFKKKKKKKKKNLTLLLLYISHIIFFIKKTFFFL